MAKQIPNPKRPKIIAKSMQKGRADWQHYLLLQDKAIYGIFDKVASDLGVALSNAEEAGRIPPYKTKTLSNHIKADTPIIRRQLSSSIHRGMSNSIDHAIKSSIASMTAAEVPWSVQVGTSFIGKDGTIRRFNIAKERYADSAWYRMNQRAVKRVLSWTPDGLTLSDRVWTIGKGTEREMLKALHQGVLEGRSAAAISRDIRYMLRMPDTLRGKKLKHFHPGRGVYKSAYKNAMRLARSELNQAFWEGTRQYVKSKTWLDGFIWRVGNIDACPICLPLDGEFFPKDEKPEQPHAQCMCHLDPHIKDDPVPTEQERQKRISQLQQQAKKAG